jgi:hypothetical protein
MLAGREIVVFIVALVLMQGVQATPPYSITSSGHTYVVEYLPSIDPLPLNRLFSIDIRVSAIHLSADPVSPQVRVTARMPAHNHGMNTQAMVRHIADGHYIADGLLFHMPGQWRILIELTDYMERTELVVIDARIGDD